MQYPLPWDTFNCSKEDTIVDVALAETHQWAKNELAPWKQYFEEHLSGTVRPRANGDGAIIHFGSIQKYSNYTRPYDAVIGVSCDTYNYRQWMRKGENYFCVLHGTPPKPLPENVAKRVCHVNPMHPCYFIPSDLPQFPRKDESHDKLRMCLKFSTPDTSFRLVVDALTRLGLDHSDKINIILMGRGKVIPKVFHNVSKVVSIVSQPDFYKFEEAMSKVS